MFQNSNDVHDPLYQAVCELQKMDLPDRPGDDLILNRIAEEMPSETSQLAGTVHSLRNIPAVFRYSVAVGFLVALVIWGIGHGNDAVLLAEVADAMAKHKTVRFTIQEMDEHGKPIENLKTTSHWTLDSMHFRYYSERDGQLRTFDYDAGLILTTNHKTKSAKLVFFTKEQAGEPRLELWQIVRDERNSKAVKETVDGIEYLVYRLTKKKDLSITTETTVWADPVTLLPVKIDWRRITKTRDEPKKENVEHSVMTDFVWDPPEAKEIDSFFSTTPLAGYTVEADVVK